MPTLEAGEEFDISVWLDPVETPVSKANSRSTISTWISKQSIRRGLYEINRSLNHDSGIVIPPFKLATLSDQIGVAMAKLAERRAQVAAVTTYVEPQASARGTQPRSAMAMASVMVSPSPLGELPAEAWQLALNPVLGREAVEPSLVRLTSMERVQDAERVGVANCSWPTGAQLHWRGEGRSC